MNKKFTKLIAALALLVFMMPSLAGWGQTQNYSHIYDYNALEEMLSGNFTDAGSYWKVPETSGNSATISIPIPYQPTSNITVTFRIATFGNGTNPSSSNTTITAVGTETNSNWTGSGVSTYPSSSTFVNGVMTINKPETPTTLGGLTITMGVNSGVKIFRLESIAVAYTYDGSGGGGGTATATLTQSKLGLTGSYTTNTEKTVDGITYKYSNLMKSNDNIQAAATTGTIKNITAYPGDITSVAITHSGTARATTINGSADGTNWTQVATGSGSITADFSGMGYKYFQITRGSNAAYWEKIDITYSAQASTQSQSDLAITNASTDFTFDLYNNSTAQVINYTTSSTGAITINPASPTSYFSYVHDATAKTITVTPLAVTPSVQTVTISQEADENYYPGTTTFTVSVANSDPTIPGSFNNPYTVAQARAAIDAGTGTQGVYVTGIVTENENHYYSQNNHYYTYFISADGLTTSDQLEIYHGKGINGDDFTSQDDIQVGDIVVVCGNLMKYQTTYEFAEGSQLVSLVRPARITVDPTTIDAPYTGEEGSLTMTYENIEEFTSFDYYFCDVVGNELEEDPNWIVAEIQEENDNYSLYYIIDANDGAARTAYLKVYTFDDELEEVYVIVTVNQAFAPDPSITIANATVNVDASEHVGTLALSYENLPIIEMEDFDVQYYDAEGEETSEPDWIEVLVAEVEGGNGYEVSYYMVENEGETRTVYFKVYSLNAEAELVYSNLVTISQEEAAIPSTGDEWVLTNLADLTADDVFVIVGDNGDTYAMSNDNGTSSAPSAVAVTVDGENNKLTSTIGSNIQWNLEITNDGFIFHPNGTTSTWLYCTNSNDGVRVGTGDAKHFNFDENYTNYLTITETNDQRFIGIYNSQDWRCYKLGSNNSFPNNIADQTFAFYKKVSNVETYETTITPNTMTGWHLIASPLAGSVKAGDVENLKSNDYDLYSFDQSKDKEWQNYKKHGFYLESGKGYLYANSGTVTLTFTGVPYSGDGEIELDYSETNENSNMRGLNLIGNPYNANTTIDSDREFYIMNSTGTQIIVADNDHKTIAPMQGIFVKAEGTGETVTFTPATQGSSLNNNSSLVLNLIQNRGDVIDRAIVRLGNGGTLPKIQLFENSTKLYISQYNEDYAVVKAEAQGEMPVNFRAAENGTYTLSIDAENVDMNYLHLIDNMTGMDIDLLQTPSYTFEATTRDYESRFRLVFAANEDGVSTGSTAFAFFSNGNWIINNDGEAILQVIDVTGRILSSESVNGSVSTTLNATPGVYMLRLINGENVKVQKVVVR